MGEQMIFKRYEIKYRITRREAEILLAGMEPYMKADEHGRSTIQSLYFDTPTFQLIRRSLEKPAYKEKLRLRSYGVAGQDTQVFIELKKKYDSIVYKRRTGMTLEEADRYLLQGQEAPQKSQITNEIDYFLSFYRGVKPAVLLTYEREAFYAKDDHEFRITFDNNILWRTEDLWLDKGIYGRKLIDDDTILMEVKVGEGIPLWFAALLSQNHIYQSSFSKYGTAYQTLFAENYTSPILATKPAAATVQHPAYDCELFHTLKGGIKYA